VPVTCVSYTARDWGVGEVWFDGERLLWHELPRARKQEATERFHSSGTRARARVTPTHEGGAVDPPPSRSTVAGKRPRGANNSAPISDEFVRRLEGYFAGDRVGFDDVAIEVEGWTTFQLAVMQALRGVPYGEVVSYSDLARIAGYPRAQRAAGTFCAHNRFGIVVPCHRVVGANGIGSYGSLGVAYKQRLLALEGVTL
jgi:methylated-DNA-[protein]-cysteine S-methyltransferase